MGYNKKAGEKILCRDCRVACFELIVDVGRGDHFSFDQVKVVHEGIKTPLGNGLVPRCPECDGDMDLSF